MGVLIIVLMLSVPVYIVGVTSKKKVPTILAAMVMAVVAANTGSPKYLLIDLVGIGIALYIAILQINSFTEPK